METKKYDLRTQEILNGLEIGKSREQLAKELGLSSWKSVDQHMRRRDYKWNKDRKVYYKEIINVEKKFTETLTSIPVKAEKVMQMFNSSELAPNPKEIALSLGFDDHRDMSNYMLENDLVWDSELSNYTKNGVIAPLEVDPIDSMAENEDLVKSLETLVCPELNDNMIEKYLPLLEMLYKNHDSIINLLKPNSIGNLPKYAVPGNPKTKSIYMSDMLAKLMAEFCQVKNLSQREVIEVALIDYLSKFGYEREVERLLLKK